MKGEHPREAFRIQCLECGKWFRALPTHLLRSHGMDDEDYRLKHIIAVGSPLVCVEWSERSSEVAVEREFSKLGTARGPKPGYKQRESVQAHRRKHYAKLASAGTKAAAETDRTEARRKSLEPYPVTIGQAVDRLGCTRPAAYTFLSFCVQAGLLQRVNRGIYDVTRLTTRASK